MKVFVSVFASILISLTIGACGKVEAIDVQDAWARPGFRGDNSAIYLTITNSSNREEGLLGAVSDVAAAAEIHLSKMDAQGIMTMERQDLVIIPKDDSVEFSPGGLHIMLVNLVKDLSVGDSFPITLEFRRAGDITVEVEVRQP
jgi:copper(I)-binding protein